VAGIGAYVFRINFWLACVMVALALILNGILAEWGDRRRDKGDLQLRGALSLYVGNFRLLALEAGQITLRFDAPLARLK
jgi:hypothetical protein